MKKTRYLICLVLIIAFSTSCMPKSKESDMKPGVDMYYSAMWRNIHSMLPVEVAFRLNILLSEAKKQGISKFDDIVVWVPSDDKSKEGELVELKLKNALFGTAKISGAGSGVYNISYTTNLLNEDAYVIKGAFEVNTGGLLLAELNDSEEGDDAWSVSVSEAVTYTMRNKTKLELKGGNYIISNGGVKNVWKIDVASNAISSEDNTGIDNTTYWSGSYTVRQSNREDMLYSSIRESLFKMSGSATGTTFGQTAVILTIDPIEPVMYMPACNLISAYNIFSGKVKVEFSNYDIINKDRFPAPEVEVEFIKDKNKCSAESRMTYNGKTEKVSVIF